MENLHTTLMRARERIGYSQEAIGAALGISRAMVSYWETGSRKPNDRQLNALARLYEVELADLLAGRNIEPAGANLAELMLRANGGVDPASSPGIHEFVGFLERHAELAEMLQLPIRGMRESPFTFREEFSAKSDISRKAEEVRAHLRLGIAPIYDLDVICETLGITLYRASLGGDLRRFPSGAFLKHPEVGFSILVNLDMTPGRRRFTIAHELAHALFHSHDNPALVSQTGASGASREAFADEFAGEFLMPREGVRQFMERMDMPRRVSDPVEAIHIQRYFRVSWATTLVRLYQMNTLSESDFQQFRREVKPVFLARSLGYEIYPEELKQFPELWTLRRFPRLFLRMLRKAVRDEMMSISTAASFAGLAVPDVVNLIGGPGSGASETEVNDHAVEFEEYESSDIISFAQAA